jgi:hypothetical protein
MGSDPHNIKTLIGAEEWKVVKCLLLAVTSFFVQYMRLRSASTKHRYISSLFNCRLYQWKISKDFPWCLTCMNVHVN